MSQPAAHAEKVTDFAVLALKKFMDVTTVDDLWTVMIDYGASMGTDILSYHHTAPDIVSGRPNISVLTNGFPDFWTAKYTKSKLHRTDPILNVFLGRLRPMRWSEIDNFVALSPAQMEYLTALRSWLKGDGFGFPVFGPSGRNGYIGIGSSVSTLADWDFTTMNSAHWVVQSFHVRYCELTLMHATKDFTLNERELLVLECLSQGTSDEFICAVVSASLDSVHQSVRSILRKMDVTDRPSAILRGIGAGLIDKDATISRMH